MTKTALDTTTEALRLIGVVAVDETAAAADHARAKAHLDAFFAELSDTHGLALDWTVETIPDRLWPFMAAAVAGAVCTAYGKPEYAGLRITGLRGIMADEFRNEMPTRTAAEFF